MIENFTLNSDEIVEVLGDIPLSDPQVMKWLRNYIQENILRYKTKREI